MSILNVFIEKIILPLSDFILGLSIYKHFKFLQKSQWFSKEELTDYQNKKLRSLIEHSYQNVPYYTELFDKLNLTPNDIKTKEDLVKLPILTKDIIRENFNNGKLIAKNISRKKIIPVGSSGSTGEPLQYYTTKDAYSFNIAANLRGWHWMGYRFGDKFIKLSQNDRSSKVKKIQDKLTRNKYLFSQQLTEENFSLILDEIIKYQPKILRGYPDPLFFLAKYAESKGINDLKIPLIATTGNMLFPEVRSFIEKQFNAKIYDAYSCEGSANFFEAPPQGFYYGTMEYAITELLEGGCHVKEGQRGRHITTDLQNYAVPFIRYDTQDYLVNGSKKLDKYKDRKLLAIEKVDGRDSDILITPSGKYLIVHNFTGYFQAKELETVTQFQVVQKTIDEISIYLVVTNEFSNKIKEEILKYWESYIGNDVKVIIKLVDEIKLTSSGKRRFLIRDKSIKLPSH